MTRGGKRDGAGRPTKDGISRKRVTVALREDLLTALLEQAKYKDISLADQINHLLADQLQLLDLPTGQVKAPAEQNQVVKNKEPNPVAIPLEEDKTETVPTYQELEKQLRNWGNNNINRHSNVIQYWRKRYRKDKTFREAMDRLAARTHEQFRNLLLDNRLPLAMHEEALALSELPPKLLKLTASRLLKGEKNLKLAVQGFEELFREAATRYLETTLGSAYAFPSELGL